MWELLHSILLLVYPMESVYITGVIDGDTIDTSLGRVRLLGINSPERGERCYIESRQAIENLTGGRISLERDLVNKDKYGRLLRHVQSAAWVNLEMVRSGMAKSYCITPNLAYCRQIEDAQAEAMNSGTGCLWSPSENKCIRISDVGSSEVVVKNFCDSEASLEGLYVESGGRQREYFSGKLCSGCEDFRSLDVGRFAMLFDEWGFIDFRAS